MATMTVEGLLATITALTEGLKLKRKELGELRKLGDETRRRVLEEDTRRRQRPTREEACEDFLDARERLFEIERVEDFTFNMLINVFNAENTASLAIEAILDTGSYASSPKTQRIEDPEKWTPEFIQKHAAEISSDKGPAGDFDD